MTKLLLILSILISGSSYAGYDESSTTKCSNGTYELVIKREGSFFGKNRIILKKSSDKLIDEEYAQNWSPEKNSQVEKLALKELPCSNKDFYQFLESKNTYVLQSYTDGSWCQDKGERDTTYIQIKKTNQIIKFDNNSQCKSKNGF